MGTEQSDGEAHHRADELEQAPDALQRDRLAPAVHHRNHLADAHDHVVEPLDPRARRAVTLRELRVHEDVDPRVVLLVHVRDRHVEELARLHHPRVAQEQRRRVDDQPPVGCGLAGQRVGGRDAAVAAVEDALDHLGLVDFIPPDRLVPQVRRRVLEMLRPLRMNETNSIFLLFFFFQAFPFSLRKIEFL